MRFITDVYIELSWPPGRAHRRAVLLYASYVGLFHYLRATRDDDVGDADMQAYADELATALVDGAP